MNRKLRVLRQFALVLLCLACVLFVGCTQLSNDELDAQLNIMLDAIEANDLEQAYAAMYPEVMTQNAFTSAFEQMRTYWPQNNSTRTCKMTKIDTAKGTYNGQHYTQISGEYTVETDLEPYFIRIVYRQDDQSSGILAFNLVRQSEYEQETAVTGTFATAAQNTPVQWLFLVFWLLSIGFVVVTVVDILRKRPRLYGLWLICALVFAAFIFQREGASVVHNRLNVSLLIQSNWLVSGSGALTIRLSLPVGAIAYWSSRRKLQKQKEPLQQDASASVAPIEPPKESDESIL